MLTKSARVPHTFVGRTQEDLARYSSSVEGRRWTPHGGNCISQVQARCGTVQRQKRPGTCTAILYEAADAVLAEDLAQSREDSGSVVVEFKLPYRCEFGQHVLVVGSDGLLGGWDVGQAAEMKWTPGDIWTIKLELGQLHDLLEYKYVIRNPDGEVVAWKPGPNCSLTLHQLPSSSKFAVSDTWDGSIHDIQEWSDLLTPAETEESLVEEAHNFQETLEWAIANPLEQLKGCVEQSKHLMQDLQDPTHPEMLAADEALYYWSRRCWDEFGIPHASQLSFGGSSY
eukprot:jgi/Botrbrau1/3820/Bobra.0183s0050.1